MRKIQERAKISQRAKTKQMATCLSWIKPSEQPLHFIWRRKRTLHSLIFSRATLAWSHDSSPSPHSNGELACRLSWLNNETQVIFDSIFCCGIKKKKKKNVICVLLIPFYLNILKTSLDVWKIKSSCIKKAWIAKFNDLFHSCPLKSRKLNPAKYCLAKIAEINEVGLITRAMIGRMIQQLIQSTTS